MGDIRESGTVLLLAILVYLFNIIAPLIGVLGGAAPLHGRTFRKKVAQMLAMCAISYNQFSPVSKLNMIPIPARR